VAERFANGKATDEERRSAADAAAAAYAAADAYAAVRLRARAFQAKRLRKVIANPFRVMP
jgi:hypothetical protein